MQTKANTLKSQRGGTKLIGLILGLILGLCLGMLALVRWPHLDTSLKLLLTEDDIRVLAEGALDSGLRPNLPELGGLTPDAPVKSESSVISTANASQRTEESPVAEYRNASSHIVPSALSESRATNLPDSVNRAANATMDIGNPLALVDEMGADRSNRDVRTKKSASATAYERLDKSLKGAPLSYETREVWQAFSSESAAQAFAAVVSKAIGIEVETLRQSDHKFIPIVRCEGPGRCDVLTAKIAALLAGSADLEVYDEI